MDDYNIKADRRDARRKNQSTMRVSGKSIFVIQQELGKRAEKVKKP